MRARVDSFLDDRLEHIPLVGKLVRYSSASISGTVTTQVALPVLIGVFSMESGRANIIAVMLGAVPNYLINRAWTWKKKGDHSILKEVVPFWAMTIVGLVLSTLAVRWADDRFDGAWWALNGANMAAFASLWVGKFFVLDRVLFRARH